MPEIIYHKLRPQDRFLILGTDGLWDELGNKEAVRIVGEHLSAIHLQVCVEENHKVLYPLFPYLCDCQQSFFFQPVFHCSLIVGPIKFFLLSVWFPRLPLLRLRDSWIWVGCMNSWWDAGPAPPLLLTPTLPRTLSDTLSALGTMGSSVRWNWPPC